MIKLRKLELVDLENYQYWNLPFHKYHLLNGPYFKKDSQEEVKMKMDDLRSKFKQGNNDPLPQKKLISNASNQIIGEVNWYWKSKETFWIEIGIVIFDEQYWGKGIGYDALKLWINELFDTKKNIVRLGLTTWSGNLGMIKLAQKLNMKKEADYKNARIVNGEYYNSVSFGILKEDWQNIEGEIDNMIFHEELILDKLTQSFFNVFTNTNGKKPNWELIRKICIPEIIIIKVNGDLREVYNLESFIKPRKTLLSSGTLLEFEEKETKHSTKVNGNIAQRESHYKKTGILNGTRFEQYGNKFFQFIKTNGRWRISSVLWEDN